MHFLITYLDEASQVVRFMLAVWKDFGGDCIMLHIEAIYAYYIQPGA